MPDPQSDLLAQRLVNQRLAGTGLRDPQEIASWFGAIQAQDFQGAKWAIGLRAKALTDAAVERAFDEGSLLRTHVLRPTWHFVTAADIRWLLALTGPRIIARMSSYHRQLELDGETVRRTRLLLTRALRDGFLTRRQIGAELARGGMRLTPERLNHVLMLAEVEGVVCSGPRRDRQFTYALLDVRVPPAEAIGREEALARLAARYFQSHGPATVADFAWWSGLSLREARAAVDTAGLTFARDALVSFDARPRRRPSEATRPSAWLLPNFDEYLVAYKDRQAVLGGSADPRDSLSHTVIVDGLAVATWRVLRQDGGVSIRVVPRGRLSREHLERIRSAASRYGRFIGRPVSVGS